MALGSWQGLYNSVVLDLMAQRRERELLLLMAIASHCDPFGFCFPGRARLFTIRHCAKETQLTHERWLAERGHIIVTETHNPRHRQYEPDYQVSPRTLYVRPEIQAYCELVFDGVEERNFAFEKGFLVILFGTKESQPEIQPESETRAFKPASVTSPMTRNNNQRDNAPTQTGRTTTTMRNGKQRDSAIQPTATSREAHRKNNLPTGGPDEFDALLSPTVDDGRLADEIKHAVSTTLHQAKQAVATYPRDGIVHWLRITALRRERGELSKPGGWFFKMLKEQVHPITIPEPMNKPEKEDYNGEF